MLVEDTRRLILAELDLLALYSFGCTNKAHARLRHDERVRRQVVHETLPDSERTFYTTTVHACAPHDLAILYSVAPSELLSKVLDIGKNYYGNIRAFHRASAFVMETLAERVITAPESINAHILEHTFYYRIFSDSTFAALRDTIVATPFFKQCHWINRLVTPIWRQAARRGDTLALDWLSAHENEKWNGDTPRRGFRPPRNYTGGHSLIVRSAIRKNRLNVIQWVHAQATPPLQSFFASPDNDSYIGLCVREMARRGRLNMLQWFKANVANNGSYYVFSLIQLAYANKHYDIAKWLIDVDPEKYKGKELGLYFQECRGWETEAATWLIKHAAATIDCQHTLPRMLSAQSSLSVNQDLRPLSDQVQWLLDKGCLLTAECLVRVVRAQTWASIRCAFLDWLYDDLHCPLYQPGMDWGTLARVDDPRHGNVPWILRKVAPRFINDTHM